MPDSKPVRPDPDALKVVLKSTAVSTEVEGRDNSLGLRSFRAGHCPPPGAFVNR